jgi:hypothetical protein
LFGYPPHWEQMDNGMWTFKCGEASRAAAMRSDRWHEIIGFGLEKSSRLLRL